MPPGFWARVLPRVRAAHPDAYIVGEVIHGDYAAIVQESGWTRSPSTSCGRRSGAASTTRNFFELAWALDRHNAFTAAFTPLTFAGNHDVTRLASGSPIPATCRTPSRSCSPWPGPRRSTTATSRPSAASRKTAPGGGDAVRPAFPGTLDELAPYGWGTYRLHQQLIGLRRRNPWLHRARTTILHLANTHPACETRQDGGRLITALNVADTPARLPAPHACTTQAGAGDLHQAAPPTRPSTSAPTAGLSSLHDQPAVHEFH